MRNKLALPTLRVLSAVGALGLAACGVEQQTATDVETQFDILEGPLTNASLQFEFSKLCKVGSAADFEITRTYGPGQTLTIPVHLEDGECKVIAEHDGSDMFDVEITEVSSTVGFALDRIEVLSDAGLDVVTGTSTVARRVPPRHVFTYFNEAIGVGRMTGGGHQVRIDDVRITRGLTIHCDIVLSNNLEINWPGNRWHLDKPLTSALCIDDPDVSPFPPAAPFDTFVGEGLGALNGAPGSWVKFTFVDAGEPGSDDTAWIRVWSPGADPALDAPVLEVSGNLTGGNLQAHYDQPHR
jgi:hypothetical protein